MGRRTSGTARRVGRVLAAVLDLVLDPLGAALAAWRRSEGANGPRRRVHVSADGDLLEGAAAARAAWRDQLRDQLRDPLPERQARWERALARVVTDVRATTPLALSWRIGVCDDAIGSDAADGPHADGAWLTASGDGDAVTLPRRLLAFGVLQLELGTGTVLGLPDVPDDPEEAVRDIAERVQDEVVMELFAAWPPCPDHAHPLEPVRLAGRASWACLATGRSVAPVGELGRPRRRDG